MTEFEKQRDLEAATYARHTPGNDETKAFQAGADFGRRYMLESDQVIKGLVDAVRVAIYQSSDEPPFIYLPKSEQNRRFKEALAAFAAERERVKEENGV